MPADRTASSATRQRKKASPSAPCTECGKVLGRASDMKRHMDTHGPKTFVCTEPGCNFASHTSSGLKVHTDRHTNTYKTCPSCSFKCHDPSILHRHRIKKHQYVPRAVATKAKKPKEYIPPCVPASVRRTISAQENTTYDSFSQFASFPSGSSFSALATPATDTLSDLSELSDFSETETGSSRSASPSLSDASSSSDFSLPDISVIRRENALREARRAYFMTSSPSYLTPAMMDELERTSRIHSRRYDLKAECPCIRDELYPPYPSYTTHSVPGYQAIGFDESPQQVCHSVLLPSLHCDDMDVSMSDEDLAIDPALLVIDDYLKAASMLDAVSLAKPCSSLQSEYTYENIEMFEGAFDRCYTNVVSEGKQKNEASIKIEESPSPSSYTEGYFVSWTDFLQKATISTNKTVFKPEGN